MPELETITVKGFKQHRCGREVGTRPAKSTVPIGPNGSGKSNFIGVFSFLNVIRDGQLQDYVARAGGADRILHFGVRQRLAGEGDKACELRAIRQ